MDLILLIGIATSLLLVLITLYFWSKRQEQPKVDPVRRPQPRPQENIPRRAQIARNQRNRLRVGAATQPVVADREAEEDSDEDEQNRERQGPHIDEKVGAKKRAKLEAKAEKKAQREIELQMREEKKKKAAAEEEERKKLEQKAEEEEKKREEVERLAREEKERKEHEEYLKLKETFSIEEEGYDEIEDEEKQNLLQEFVKYIEENKVVVLEDLATHFKLKTPEVIDRITQLQANGTLTGVIDDRGKFIYISEEELLAVAKFIKQRGRVSITELAECSNKLINLSGVTT